MTSDAPTRDIRGGTAEANLAQIAEMLSELRRAIHEIRETIHKNTKEYLTVEEVAELTGRAPYTVRTWIRDGIIHAERVVGTGPRGRLLIARMELNKLITLGRGHAISDYESPRRPTQ